MKCKFSFFKTTKQSLDVLLLRMERMFCISDLCPEPTNINIPKILVIKRVKKKGNLFLKDIGNILYKNRNLYFQENSEEFIQSCFFLVTGIHFLLKKVRIRSTIAKIERNKIIFFLHLAHTLMFLQSIILIFV